MRLQTYIPSEALRPYVKSFVVQETGEESTYRVLPDTGLVIGFQYKGKLSRLDNTLETPLSVSGISGLADHSRIFKNSADIGSVLVFFKDAGASPFFHQPLNDLFRESVSLDNFMLRSELLCVEEQLAEATSDVQRIAVVEQFLISRMNPGKHDELIPAALQLIYQSKGTIRIKELASKLCISQSPLEKRFREAVGASPKKFASIVRLKNVLQQYNDKSSLTELGYESGFYDQAHFIREFKTFTGETPETFFRSKGR
ncbi:MAG TPA: helix-turn-helix domain-containing protein [Flavipsychrobacter sp.]|nr:helix-turn-helix domain-containing protein [Flavipsychrobacter sp.]